MILIVNCLKINNLFQNVTTFLKIFFPDFKSFEKVGNLSKNHIIFSLFISYSACTHFDYHSHCLQPQNTLSIKNLNQTYLAINAAKAIEYAFV